jgi:hypothetical protein
MNDRLDDAAAGGEEGHAVPALGALVGAIGAVVLGIGAANDSGATAIAGGIVLAVGVLVASVADHMMVEYGIYDRLEKLEGKDKP